MSRDAQADICWATFVRSLPAGQSSTASYFEAERFGGEGEDDLADTLGVACAAMDQAAPRHRVQSSA